MELDADFFSVLGLFCAVIIAWPTASGDSVEPLNSISGMSTISIIIGIIVRQSTTLDRTIPQYIKRFVTLVTDIQFLVYILS